MKIQRKFGTGLMRTAAVLVGVVASTLLLASAARAEALSRYQPEALIQAEWALEDSQPERALLLLHRQRTILRFDQFRSQRDALTCQAYLQIENLPEAARVCDGAVAYAGDDSYAEIYDRSDD
jgi:hypothetical protein